MKKEDPHYDRRSGGDRRRKPTNPLSLSSLFGSRRGFRRREDAQRHRYVDQYSIRISFLVIYVALLSVSDTLLTLKILSLGGQELNPLMAILLGYGVVPFLVVKHAITGLGLVFLLVHKDYRPFTGRFTGSYILALFALAYTFLIFWEIYLLVR